MKIYVASSWRNILQPGVVGALRAAGHEVYDYKNPGPGKLGFSWKQTNPDWRMGDPVTIAGHKSNIFFSGYFGSHSSSLSWK